MTFVGEQDHYQILEVPRDATSEDIERAYRLARSTYADDSVAIYSLMEEDDLESLRERIDDAYRVLSDDESRRSYDSVLRDPSAAPRAGGRGETLPPAAPAETLPVNDFEELEEDDSGPFDGARLRRTRMRRGLDLDQISKITKIKPEYLVCVEEERFDELPASAYVRGFVLAYAAGVGLEPKRVAQGYMKRLEAHRGDEKSRLIADG